MSNITPPIEVQAGCIAAANTILGQKWTALILRDLAENPCRFCDFERSIPGLNPRTLSKRLDDLVEASVVEHVSETGGYRLTQKGQDLIPVLRAMADWGNKYAPVSLEVN